ncbi:NAD-binding protein [Mycena kentingensis (nom. inval.)]|nr:NAD-binding protein [Mycena kentingensis (nom. inval.)]
MASAPKRKLILVVGSTGKQGQAVIRSLYQSPDYHLWALTRNLDSPHAKSLAAHTTPEQVTLVQADLDKPDTVRAVFENAKKSEYGVVFGVFLCAGVPGARRECGRRGAPGKGAYASSSVPPWLTTEQNLADLAAEHGVASFVFSSVERGGEYNDDNAVLDRRAKVLIERHVKALGESKGLPWTILRPGFFMENYDGTIGSVAAGVLKKGLKPTTKNQLIAAEDIGRVGAAVLENPEEWKHQILVVVAESLTMKEQEAAYKRGTGKTLPAVAGWVAAPLIALNGHTKALIADIERVHAAINTSPALAPEVPAQTAAARRAFPELQSFEEWARNRGGKWEKQQKGWNQASVRGVGEGEAVGAGVAGALAPRNSAIASDFYRNPFFCGTSPAAYPLLGTTYFLKREPLLRCSYQSTRYTVYCYYDLDTGAARREYISRDAICSDNADPSSAENCINLYQLCLTILDNCC